MIRPATVADLPALCRMAADFDAAAGLALDGPGEGFDPGHFARLAERLIAHRLGLALVLDLPGGVAGMFLALAGPARFRPTLWADEVAFWIDPPARGRWAGAMLADYEAWARALGARVAGVSALEPRAARLFSRRGYAPADVKLCKVL